MSLAEQHGLDLHVHLRASDDARNVRRDYEILRSTDLFGTPIIEWSWGRTGTRGQGRAVSFASESDALKFAHSLLRRRESARKRCGADYRIVGTIATGHITPQAVKGP